MRVGLIARMDMTGLGQGQTLRLARLLKPHHIMLIDSSPFNGNEQHPEWYDSYSVQLVKGFPTAEDVAEFCKKVDVVISCETFYNNYFTEIANGNHTKTILIANWEFLDYHLPDFHHLLPSKIVFPSKWNFDKMHKPIYLPTPIFDDEFKAAREVNLERTGKRKYLFMNGKSAHMDRAGLNDLYAALELSKGDFTVAVKAQGEVKKHPDPRLIYDFSNPINQSELYTDFDAMIHPRRYGGQSLPMTEALVSGLPVVMTNIDPNNEVLPDEWLVEAKKRDSFMARTNIDVYSAVPSDLAVMLDTLDVSKAAKMRAYEIGQQFEAENLRQQYKELLV